MIVSDRRGIAGWIIPRDVPKVRCAGPDKNRQQGRETSSTGARTKRTQTRHNATLSVASRVCQRRGANPLAPARSLVADAAPRGDAHQGSVRGLRISHGIHTSSTTSSTAMMIQIWTDQFLRNLIFLRRDREPR